MHTGVWRTAALRGPENRRVGFGAPRSLCGEHESKMLCDTQNLQLLELLRLAAVANDAELMCAECVQASGYIVKCTPVVSVSLQIDLEKCVGLEVVWSSHKLPNAPTALLLKRHLTAQKYCHMFFCCLTPSLYERLTGNGGAFPEHASEVQRGSPFRAAVV